MAVKCAAKSLLERKQGLQSGVWEQNSAESAANDEHPARHFVQLLGNRTEPSEERRKCQRQMDAVALSQLYRDRGDCENNFDLVEHILPTCRP